MCLCCFPSFDAKVSKVGMPGSNFFRFSFFKSYLQDILNSIAQSFHVGVTKFRYRKMSVLISFFVFLTCRSHHMTIILVT